VDNFILFAKNIANYTYLSTLFLNPYTQNRSFPYSVEGAVLNYYNILLTRLFVGLYP